MNTKPFASHIRAHLPSRRHQRGVTSIEYALLGALIAVAIVVGVTSVGVSVNDLYSLVSGAVANAVPKAAN